MNFTFGIITSGGVDERIQTIVNSIRAEKIPTYEILIVGNCAVTGSDIRSFPFDESVKAGWLNRKKNIVLTEAVYDYVCVLHDYVALEPGWYEGFLKGGVDWSYGTSRVVNQNGERYRDRLIYRWGMGHLFPRRTWLPDDADVQPHQMKLLYVSGAHFVIRRDIGQEHLLDDRLVHQQGEDVEYAQRLSIEDVPMQLNPHSTVRFLKKKDKVEFDHPMTAEEVVRFITLSPEECEQLFDAQRIYLRQFYASFGISLGY